ncbi:MAG: glutamate-1-semialdehyde 2,1-aminomutase [Syntrophorhabdaceae bacterium]|nr:glutamate-1-semialdehyde 2,1-aminomutase [Syntrophorhabdaceae bacterium]
MRREKSDQLYREAEKHIPGGVNSPVRAFKSVNDEPFYVKRAKGAYLYDVDGNRYIDYVSSWGAIILGHAYDGLLEEIKKAIEEGTSFGACHQAEIELAKMIKEAYPSIELVRLTSSGTEATMSALRLARGYTGKNGVVKFRGCYHGHGDSLLVKAGSGLATFGIPDSGGVPEDLARHTFIAEFNHIESLERIFEKEKDIACVIMEPIMGNMGVILPEDNFLEDVRKLCSDSGILLIFDEVITGFRVGYRGAQGLYRINPDITCLGKILGGGFPIGAFGGKREIMGQLAPLGNVYQAGTLSGNPVAVKSGIYVLDYLKKNPQIYNEMDVNMERLIKGFEETARKYGIPLKINKVTGMFTGFFTDQDVVDYASAMTSSKALYERFFKSMIEEGIFFAPSPYEAAFLNMSHKEEEISRTLDAFDRAMKKIK